MAGWIGAGGALVFVAVFLLEGWARSGYSPVRHPVSALALGARGWIQTLNFILCGAAVAVGGMGMAISGRSLVLGAALAAVGIGLLLSGTFRMDPVRGYPPGTPEGDPLATSIGHRIHDGIGMILFLVLPTAAALATVVLPETGWKIVSGVVAVWLFRALAAFGAAWENDSPRTGLIQRAFLVPGMLWTAAVMGS
ncbi:DUF998 domain-containing protein [Cellulosimicrobium funkei]|nr:DUF998 domain-containing protein [Cellulosimicrobium funkei]